MYIKLIVYIDNMIFTWGSSYFIIFNYTEFNAYQPDSMSVRLGLPPDQYYV